MRACSKKAARIVLSVAPILPSVGAMARSSSPKHSGSGSQQSVPKPPTSCRAVHGKTAIARASTRNSVTNCSTAKSSTRSRKRRSSSKTGDSITTQCGHIHHWATNHRHPKQPSGLHKMGQRQHQQWQADRSCTNIPNGSPRGGRPHWLSSLSASPNAQCSELTEAGNNGFNRQEQGAAIFRVFNELRIAQIKSLGRFILRLNHHSPYADAL